MQWEYKMIGINFERGFFSSSTELISAEDIELINELGRQGWELINAVPFQEYEITQVCTLFFKRSIQ